MMTLRLLPALLLALLLALPAAAAERINSFNSDVKLDTSGTVDVTETINLEAEGIGIRHGIFRDIPTLLTNPDKSLLRSDLTVIGVMRDGRAEPYTVESIGKGFQRIRIGDADTLVSFGPHTYVIHYTMTRMVRFQKEFDELYWNVTGNYWSLPITATTATVTLPDGASIQQVQGFTGWPGSHEQALVATKTGDTTASFKATRLLLGGDPASGSPSEGLSIDIAFKKGAIPVPGGITAASSWLSDHRDSVLSIVSLAIVLLYNLWAWTTVGRDPRKGIIIPLFHPPASVSPPLAHYVHRMGWQKNGWTAFTSAIFDLGVKGLVLIDNAAKKLKVTVTGKTADALPSGEDVLLAYLTAKGSVTVDTTNGPELNAKRGEVLKAIETGNRQKFFRNNHGYVALSVLISLILLGIMVLADVLNPLVLVFAVGGGIILGVVGAVLSGVARGGPVLGRIIIVIWAVIFGVNIIGSFGSMVTALSIDVGAIATVSIIVINVVFGVLMRAPTVEGRKLMDQIDGFKMYLETAEKNRLNIQNEPPMTVERFEAILPYAIALGVEKPWSDHFEGELARNAVEDAPAGGYSPIWYSGNNWQSDSKGFSNSVSAVATGMSAAMMAAQPASASSSGFSSGGGGGGGSGGGGGGGGGGGW